MEAGGHGRNPIVDRNDTVGRLSVRETVAGETMDLPTGEFGGLPESKSKTILIRNPLKEWGMNLELGPRRECEREEWHDNYEMPGNAHEGRQATKVGRLGFHGRGSGDESFAGGIVRKRGGEGDGNGGEGVGGGDDDGSVDGNGASRREGAPFVHGGPVRGEDDRDNSTIMTLSNTTTKNPHNEKKKYR